MSCLEAKLRCLQVEQAQYCHWQQQQQHVVQAEQDQLQKLDQSNQNGLDSLDGKRKKNQDNWTETQQKESKLPTTQFQLKENESSSSKNQQNGLPKKKADLQREKLQLPRLQNRDEFLEHQELLQQTQTQQQGQDMRRVASCNSADKLGRRPRGPAERRRVQFADEMGLDLAKVRVMSEPSSAPPVLPRHILAAFKTAQSAIDSASDSETEGSSAGAEDRCRFECRFEQPGSRYILFRENLERNCVCLSGLHFEGWTALGIIGVKNVCFDKRVFVRATFDSWSSYKDFDATYCPGSEGSTSDSFTFSFPCPKPAIDFEFCVGFEAANLGQTFWDNGNGQNYRVAAVKSSSKKKIRGSKITDRLPVDQFERFTSSYRPSFAHVTEFSEYAAWEHHASLVYY